ncbi:hypothetical protein [Desulforhabdus sp. TSK]|uniref:hypothetical protein n=1 Tax=Desulforhabdus sp. TSK TaxID=2925014 RepID=UPI001FC84E9A|nr:hypothetical protein [Desulforhabdus sp. TSK]GKT10686.1 hypothetical protein DSTSK_39910 [Desulforhabdus sp. TSK]
MKKRFWTAVLTVALVGGLASYAMAKEEKAAIAGQKPGAIVTDVTQLTATVKAVDPQKHTVTLEGKEGKTVTVHAPNARNLDQVQVGDKVKVDYVEELAIFVTKAGEPVGGEEAQTVALAPKGAKPDGIIANTTQVQANVKDIDYKKRTITLETPDGQLKTLKVDKSVKRFKEIKKGDQVVMRFTEAIALEVTQP